MVLTERRGNPAERLRTHYATLMEIKDARVLAEAALDVVSVGGGITTSNLRKFERNLRQAQAGGLARLQGFISNFLLAADGLRVVA